MSRRRPSLTKKVIEGLLDVRSIASVFDLDGDEVLAERIERGVGYIDELIEWQEQRRAYLAKRARRPKASR